MQSGNAAAAQGGAAGDLSPHSWAPQRVTGALLWLRHWSRLDSLRRRHHGLSRIRTALAARTREYWSFNGTTGI